MPPKPDALIEISAFNWVPPFAEGLVRDFRVRWALEEAGLPYRVRLLDSRVDRPESYYLEQPFGQVPIYCEGELRLCVDVAAERDDSFTLLGDGVRGRFLQEPVRFGCGGDVVDSRHR